MASEDARQAALSEMRQPSLNRSASHSNMDDAGEQADHVREVRQLQSTLTTKNKLIQELNRNLIEAKKDVDRNEQEMQHLEKRFVFSWIFT
jgi:uncharacterized coiled-coil protein SlyX